GVVFNAAYGPLDVCIENDDGSGGDPGNGIDGNGTIVDTEWTVEDVASLLAAAEGSEADLEAIRDELTSQGVELSGLRGDFSSGDVSGVGDGEIASESDADLEGALDGLAPTVDFVETGPLASAVIPFPMPDGSTHQLSVPIDPRSWDLSDPTYAAIDTWRQIIRGLLVIVVLAKAVSAVWTALRQY
ncbi:MAG: hypothetical protein AAGG01_00815, partial [Planctomycetota bacterium]